MTRTHSGGKRRKRNERHGRAIKIPVVNPRTRGGINDRPNGSCGTCGKRCFNTKEAAKKNAKAMGVTGKGMRPYRCGDYWHLGHLAEPVIRGEATRDEVYR